MRLDSRSARIPWRSEYPSDCCRRNAVGAEISRRGGLKAAAGGVYADLESFLFPTTKSADTLKDGDAAI
jgi:hypothetical protein